MLKEFIVNDRKLATVECAIPVCKCPVFQRVFDIDNKDLPLFATTYQNNATTGIRMETTPNKLHALKSQVMNLCMECNVNSR